MPDRCGGCGADLADAPIVGVRARQVFDLPPLRLGVAEHRAERRRCACRSTTTRGPGSEAATSGCWATDRRPTRPRAQLAAAAAAARQPATCWPRLNSHCNEVLRSLDDTRVPFDNNQAERDLRMVKLQQKISRGAGAPWTAAAFLTLRSYVSTARKHKMNPLAVLRQLFQGHPWPPAPAES